MILKLISNKVISPFGIFESIVYHKWASRPIEYRCCQLSHQAHQQRWPSTSKRRWILVGFESWMDVEKWHWMINVEPTLIQRWINVDARFNQRWIFSIFCSNITSLYSVIQTYFMVRNSLQLCWQKHTKKETWFLTTLQESRINKWQQWKWTKFLNTRPHPMQIKTGVTGLDCHWKRCG